MEPASSKKAAAHATKKKAGSETKPGEAAVDGMNVLRIDDAPLPKSKNLDVLKEFEKTKSKKSASFVVVGKVHGDNPHASDIDTDLIKATWTLARAL